MFYCLDLIFIALMLIYGTSIFELWRQNQVKRGFRQRVKGDIPRTPASNARKPDWVKWEVLALHEEYGLSHRKLANLFNQLHFAKMGQTVGRTYVRQLLIKEEHRRLQLQKDLKHNLPTEIDKNVMWAADTTYILDQANGKPQIVLGIIDHGSRMSLALRYLRHLNAWTFLGCIFLAIGEYGIPLAIKTDNCAVFHSKMVKRVLRWCGIAQRFSRPARPWENGRIERFFGTLKAALRGYAIRDIQHLALAMAQFQCWYNHTRPHQHLMGQTPAQSWGKINPLKRVPQMMIKLDFWDGKLKGVMPH